MVLLSLQEAQQRLSSPLRPDQWTVIIPAAGRGSRLGYDKPKILFPIAGKLALDWLVDLLAPKCEKFIFVLSPTGAPHVTPLLSERLAGRCMVVIQDEPRGMADAIFQTMSKVTTPYTLIIWGDQVAIQPTTLQAVMHTQQESSETQLTMPIVERDSPYVHYATDESGRFTHVLERREGAEMPAVGQSDCGLFAFRTDALKNIFNHEVTHGITYSKGTQEWNFLPMLPQLDAAENSVIGLRITTYEETIGINDSQDVARLESYLKGVHHGG